MNKKCLLFSAAFAVAITFIACGDDSSTSASDSKSQSSEVKSFDDLPKCKSKNEGDTIFVKADDASYVCEAREWVLVEDENSEDDKDLSSSSENESSSSFDKSKYDEVKTKDDLDACTTKNKGDSVYVTKEDAVFTCENKKWVEVVIENEVDEPKYEEFKTIKDLPKCDSKTKGDSVYVTKEDAVYTCENKEWVEVKEESDDKDSGKKNKDDDDDDDDDVSSNSKKDKSSSSKDDEEKSSSSKDEEKSSSSNVTSSSSENTSSSSEVNSSSSENSSSSSEVTSSSSEKSLEELLVEELGECTSVNANKLKKSENNKYYVCVENSWIEESNPTELDIKLGHRCYFSNLNTYHNAGEVIEYCPKIRCKFESDFEVYQCKGYLKPNNESYGYWEKLSEYQIDILGIIEDCTLNGKNGEIFKGRSEKEYVCNKGISIKDKEEQNVILGYLLTKDSLNKIFENSTCVAGTPKYKEASWKCEDGKWKFDAKAATGEVKDKNGSIIPTVWIGFQNWMSVNLNSGEDNENGIYCFNDLPNNCNLRGSLYTYDAALEACPTGWHLPTNADWDELKSFIKNDNGFNHTTIVGKYLKNKDLEWGDYKGLNTYGFGAIPTGYGYTSNNISYTYYPEETYFRSADITSDGYPYAYKLSSTNDELGQAIYNNKVTQSVRCIED